MNCFSISGCSINCLSINCVINQLRFHKLLQKKIIFTAVPWIAGTGCSTGWRGHHWVLSLVSRHFPVPLQSPRLFSHPGWPQCPGGGGQSSRKSSGWNLGPPRQGNQVAAGCHNRTHRLLRLLGPENHPEREPWIQGGFLPQPAEEDNLVGHSVSQVDLLV